MTNKSLLEVLFSFPCLLTKAYHSENGATLSIDKKKDLNNDEILLFFCIDEEKKTIKKFLGKEKQQGHRICDLLVFYANSNKRFFCFVEFKETIKENNLTDAIEQLESTYNDFKESFYDKSLISNTKAFICSSKKSLPTNLKPYQKRLSQKFSDAKLDGDSKNFLAFLRS